MKISSKIKKAFSQLISLFQKSEEDKLLEEKLSQYKRQQFIDENKVNPKKLLDPKICIGYKFIENILIVCGVKPEIAKSPIAQAEVKEMFFKIVGADKKLEIDILKNYEISIDTIKRCVKKLKKQSKPVNNPKTTLNKTENAFIITDDGNIILIGDLRNQEDRKNPNTRKYGTKKLYLSEKSGGLAVEEDYQFILGEDDFTREEHKITTRYNRYNIMMEKKDKRLQQFLETFDIYHISQVTRNEKYPFIVHKTIETRSYDDDMPRAHASITIACTGPSKKLLDFDLPDSGLDIDKLGEMEELVGETEKKIEEYCDSHKESIQEMFSKFQELKTRYGTGSCFFDLYNYARNTYTSKFFKEPKSI